MTEITLKLTFEELKQIDKFVELNDETRPLFDKIKNAYPKPETLLDVIRNLGYSYDMCYEIVDAVEEFEKSKEPEKWDIKVKTDYLTGKARHKWNIVDKDGNDYKPTPQEPEDDEWTIDKLQEKNWYVDAKTNLKSNWEPKSKEPEENEWKSVALRFGEKLSGYLSDGYYELSPNAWFRWAVFTYGKGQQIKNAVRESVKWCEEHPDKDPLDWVKPQTPEETEQGLKEAFREAVKQGIIHEVDKVSDVFMNEMVAELKGQTLYDLIADWWDEIFMNNNEAAVTIESLVDDIEKWLPKEQSSAGSQNVDVELLVDGFNDCLKKIKDGLG